MKPVVDILEEKISAAMKEISGVDSPAVVTPAKDPKFGDYQANGAMALAKKLKTNPRELAQKVVDKLDLSDMCESPEVAGPGFINLRLKSDFLSKVLIEIAADSKNHLGISKVAQPQRIVVDFSGPNIAKQMHVGHLRSTIIGDSICRVLEFLGHTVIRQNHIGDWGTQFGKVILGLWHICIAEKKHTGQRPYYQTDLEKIRIDVKDETNLKVICLSIAERQREDWLDDPHGEKFFSPFLNGLGERNVNEIWEKMLTAYQYVNILEETVSGMGLTNPTYIDGEIKEIPFEFLSRHVTAMLQKGGSKNKQERDAWSFVRELTLKQCNKSYEELNVTLNDGDVRGESEYNPDLPNVVKELKQEKLAVESEGAVCVFSEGFKNKDGEPLPLIVQKSDGAYLYATTDLAAIRYRVNELKADKIVYVTDARQALHFDMVFTVADMAGWAKRDVLHHVTFGSVLGENGKPLKTREGENVKLKDLLDEAVERARAVVEEKNPELSPEKKERIAKAVGIGAVKYADYSNNRTSDYIFSFEKMLAMDGNTAPYMQYAYARIKSIERKAESREVDIETELADIAELNLTEPAEVALAKHLLRYGEVIESAAADYRPNYLTAYLYELAQKFSGFYTDCPVLKAKEDKRPTRLLLCDLTAQTIRHGLTELLGIEVVEQM